VADAFDPRQKKNTARGIVVHDGHILLMERWRGQLHYFSIPGGGIEPGETAEQTVLREILEETSLRVDVERQVLEMRDDGFTHKIYLCRYISGEPHLPDHAPEAVHMTENNRFRPGWVPLDKLPHLPFTYWQPIRQPLIDGLADEFKGPAKIVSIRSSG
jgi:8-oxo-dGTP pyrophosphatase MutT (NUDIX family)